MECESLSQNGDRSLRVEWRMSGAPIDSVLLCVLLHHYVFSLRGLSMKKTENFKRASSPADARLHLRQPRPVAAGSAVALASALVLVLLVSACATKPPPPPPPPPPAPVAVYSGPSLQIEQSDRGVQIFLPSTVLFDAGKADFKQAEAAPYLDRLAKLLTDKTKNKVAVEGHTDNAGNAAGNQKLSEQRAETVRAALVQRGVPADRLSALGYSFNRPMASNATDQGKAINRRVELIILDEKVANITAGEPAGSFESAFDKLKKMVQDGLIKPMVAGAQ